MLWRKFMCALVVLSGITLLQNSGFGQQGSSGLLLAPPPPPQPIPIIVPKIVIARWWVRSHEPAHEKILKRALSEASQLSFWLSHPTYRQIPTRAFQSLLLMGGEVGSHMSSQGQFVSSFPFLPSFGVGNVVYVTPYGGKFHRADCPHLRRSGNAKAVSLLEALQKGLSACKTCNP